MADDKDKGAIAKELNKDAPKDVPKKDAKVKEEAPAKERPLHELIAESRVNFRKIKEKEAKEAKK